MIDMRSRGSVGVTTPTGRPMVEREIIIWNETMHVSLEIPEDLDAIQANCHESPWRGLLSRRFAQESLRCPRPAVCWAFRRGIKWTVS